MEIADTTLPLLHGATRGPCVSRAYGSALSLSHRLNVLPHCASVMAVVAVVAAMVMWEGAWARGGEGMQGDAKGCAVYCADGIAMLGIALLVLQVLWSCTGP